MRGKRAASARDMFHGHRSLDDAVLSFDTALSSVRWRKTWVPVRWVYETKRLLARMRPRRPRSIEPLTAKNEPED